MQQAYIYPRTNIIVFFISSKKLDGLIIGLKTKFKVELYFYVLDVETNYFEKEFQQMHKHCDNFKF